MRNYKNIKAWQKADQLAFLVYKASKKFPREELYGLTSQLRRAVITEYLLHFSYKIGFLSEPSYKELETLRAEAASTLYGLIGAVDEDMELDKSFEEVNTGGS